MHIKDVVFPPFLFHIFKWYFVINFGSIIHYAYSVCTMYIQCMLEYLQNIIFLIIPTVLGPIIVVNGAIVRVVGVITEIN